MAYKMENYRLVSERFAERRKRAEKEAEERREEVRRRCPEIGKIDEALAKTGMRIFMTATAANESNAKEKIAEIRRENEELLAERGALLLALGLPSDYTEARYACKRCADTGYDNCRMCDCMRRELTLEGFRSSGMGRLIERQSFDNFSLDYYKSSQQDYEMMARNLEIARDFAENAPPAYLNLLLLGNTGLGKTHLSTAIARRVIERGYEVRYESILNIMEDFKRDHFHSEYGERYEDRSRGYMESELLIIDDLGTEVTNRFTQSCLYQIINTRINQGRPTIISTNLEQRELRDRYDDRVTSRLFGEYLPLLFRGKDIRFQAK